HRESSVDVEFANGERAEHHVDLPFEELLDGGTLLVTGAPPRDDGIARDGTIGQSRFRVGGPGDAGGVNDARETAHERDAHGHPPRTRRAADSPRWRGAGLRRLAA